MFGRTKNDGDPVTPAARGDASRGEDKRLPEFLSSSDTPAASPLAPLASDDHDRESAGARSPRPAMEPRGVEMRAPDVRVPDVRAPKKMTAAPAPDPRQRPEEDKTLTVGRDISLHGEIADCAKVHVDGKVEATLSKCRALIITESGYFGGTAEVETADISGRFDGALECAGRLIIRENGRVNGDVRYGQIEIECGGELSGKVGTVESADSEESDVEPSNDDQPERSAASF